MPQSFFQSLYMKVLTFLCTWWAHQDHPWHRCSNVLVDDILMILLLDDVAVTLFIKEPCLELAEHSRHTFGTIHFPEVIMCCATIKMTLRPSRERDLMLKLQDTHTFLQTHPWVDMKFASLLQQGQTN